jgi:hypothetical protein
MILSSGLSQKERRRLRMEYIRNKKMKINPDSLSDNSTVTSDESVDLNYLSTNSHENSVLASVETVTQLLSHSEKTLSQSEIRKEARKIRNRESAEASRKRRRNDVQTLQAEVSNCLSQISYLKEWLSKYEPLESINAKLQSVFIQQFDDFPLKTCQSNKDTLLYYEPAVFSHSIYL